MPNLQNYSDQPMSPPNMACGVIGKVVSATVKGKSNFGCWFKRCKSDSSSWPDDLYEWAKAKGVFESRDGLTMDQFCEWLALRTGRAFLAEPTYVRKFADVQRWCRASGKSQRSELDVFMLAALTKTGFLTYQGTPVTDDNVIVDVLTELIDPLEPFE
ncbi:MAG: hypothetical protein AAFV72_00060 [Cyanobacteria bacterium J06635_1]